MSMYDSFADLENATVLIKTVGAATTDPDTLQPVYSDPVEVYNSTGIYYELSASEKIQRQQIQKDATGQVVLDPEKVTTSITEDMKLYITTTLLTEKEYRIVTVKNPLNDDEVVTIDIKEQ